MSGWDAPTGSWDSREESEESSGPDELGYQQEPTGAYRTAPGSEARLRAGRRGLPGYDQAQSYDQATGSYDQATGFDQGSGFGSGPGYGSASGYEQETGTGQQPSFGTGAQRSIGPASGYPQGSAGPDPQRTSGSVPPRAIGAGPSGPVGSAPQRPVGSSPQTSVSPAPASPRVPRAALGSGPQAAVGYDEAAAGGFPGYGSAEDTRPSRPGSGDQPGYRSQPGYGTDQGYTADQGYGTEHGYGTRPGYGPEGSGGEPGYGQHAPAPGGFLPGGAGRPEQSQPDLDYQTEAYPPQGFAQNGSGPSAFGQGEYGRGGSAIPPVAPTSGPGRSPAGQPYPAQDYQTEAYPLPGSEPPAGFGEKAAPGAPAQDSFSQAAYPQAGYGQDGYGQDEYSPDTYGRNGFGPGGFGPPGALHEGYAQEAYAQPGFDPAGAPDYGDDDSASGGRPPRSGLSRPRLPRSGQRSPRRPGGIRMALYLAASVVGVVVIVFLVIHLTKKSPSIPAAGSTPRTGTGTTAAAGAPASGLVFTQAAKIGSYPLNQAATREFTLAAQKQAVPSAASVRAQGAGQPGKDVVGIYNLTPVTSINSAGYRGMVVVGYDGTFNPSAVIKLARAELKSSRKVKAGPNGGQMVCGYNTTTGSAASECMWVTKTTFGQVEFLSGTTPVKYQGAAKLALQVRKAIEVRAS